MYILSHPADNENSFREVTMHLYDTLVDTHGIAVEGKRGGKNSGVLLSAGGT